MSSHSLTSPFTGIICEILAGSEQKVFFAHDSILLKCPDFKAIIEEDWEYGQPRVFIEDWSEDSVSRLIEWLYSGDYSAPYPGDMDHQSPGRSPGTLCGDPNIRGSTPQTERPAELVHPPTPSNDLQSNNQDLFHRRSQGDGFIRWYKDFAQHSASINCEATLLAHAELYTLACDYQLHDLQALVLSRLQSTLQFLDGFTAKTPVVGNLVTLVEYIYDNISRPATGQEPLRKLMTSFIAHNFNNFDDDDGGAVQRLSDVETDFLEI